MKYVLVIMIFLVSIPVCAKDINLSINDILAVHKEIRNAPYISDMERYGMVDAWVVDKNGDCEDKALWAARELVRRGGNPDAIELALYKGHAFIIIEYKDVLLSVDFSLPRLTVVTKEEASEYKYVDWELLYKGINNDNNDNWGSVG